MSPIDAICSFMAELTIRTEPTPVGAKLLVKGRRITFMRPQATAADPKLPEPDPDPSEPDYPPVRIPDPETGPDIVDPAVPDRPPSYRALAA